MPGRAGLRAGQPFAGEEADAHRVHEAVVGVRRVEDGFAADGRDAGAVPVVADPGDGSVEVMARLAEAQPVEQRDRPRSHGDDVAQDPAHACRRALERLDRGRVVVALDLEGDRLPLAEVEHAGIFPRSLQDALSAARQPLEQERRVLVATMLGPEQREDGQLEVVRVALEQPADTLQLRVGQPERLVERLFRDPRQELQSSREGRRAGRR
jgi:hypothetical protein